MLLILAFCEGGAVMLAELVGARMVAPLYGNSLYVWGSVIGVSLISLAAGYYLGGVLSNRPSRHPSVVYWLMLAAALLIALMPVSANTLMLSLEGVGTVKAILVSTSIYLAPPLLLLGATTPLIITLLATDAGAAGGIAGRVFAVSTFGGILATFAAGFYLIPEFGLTVTARATGIALAVLPFALLLGHRQYLALVHPVLLGGVLIASAQPAKDHPGVELLYESEGLLGQIKLADVHFVNKADNARRTDRILFVNRMAQTWIDRDSGVSRWEYVRYVRMVGSTLPEGSRVLLLGLGGGIIARILQDLGHTVDSVELDERIAKVATEYFGLVPNGDMFVDDGRHFIRSTDRRYDLIVFDVFQAEIPPAHMLTVEAFRELRDHLNPGGFVVINYSGFLEGSVGYGARSIYKTLLAAGFQVRLLPTAADEDGRNNLYIAWQGEKEFPKPRLPVVIDGSPREIGDLFVDAASIDVEHAMILTDNQPVLERLNLEAAAIWRAAYFKYFTKPFLEMGIPLFD